MHKTILITGGTGSLGKVLVNRLKADNRVIVYSRDEGKQALDIPKHPNIECVIGDVRDLTKLKTVCRCYEPNTIIHTAALKRIPELELQPDEGVKTNIVGSENVAIAALESPTIEKCMLISTDKACQPINVYGAGKFISERTFTNFNYKQSRAMFSSVRYGNVIASRGSFIPLWLGQIEKGETISITSPQCTRYMFTLQDAADTVLKSIELMWGGEVFVPNLPSYSLPTVIKALEIITGKQIDYKIRGLRPGEKLHEDMISVPELDFAYNVDFSIHDSRSVEYNHKIPLIGIFPQYYKNYAQLSVPMTPYEGPELNSRLHVSDDAEELARTIQRGIDEVS